MKTTQTRRTILRRAAQGAVGLIVTATLGPIVLSACKKTNNESNSNSGNANVVPCPNQDNLSEQDKNIRNSLKYVDGTPLQGRTCDNCKLYTLPVQGSLCGGCKVVPGPIHPKGYCTAWLHRM